MKVGDLARFDKSAEGFPYVHRFAASRAYIFETGLVMEAIETDSGKAVAIMFPSGMKNVLCEALEVISESR